MLCGIPKYHIFDSFFISLIQRREPENDMIPANTGSTSRISDPFDGIMRTAALRIG